MYRRQRRELCVHSERQLQAWWQYALPPRHAVSAAVAACSVEGGRGLEGECVGGGRGWAPDLFVFTPTLQKEKYSIISFCHAVKQQ